MALLVTAVIVTAVGVGLGTAAYMKHLLFKEVKTDIQKGIEKIVEYFTVGAHGDGKIIEYQSYPPIPSSYQNKYNKETAMFLSTLCENVSTTNAVEDNPLPIPESFEIQPVQFSTEHSNVAYFFHDTSQMVTYLIWSGTSTMEMWKEDAKCKPIKLDDRIYKNNVEYLDSTEKDTYPHVHHGFQEIYLLFRDKIHSNWKTKYAHCSKKLIIAGHSLGGAMATLSAVDFIHSEYDRDVPILVYTFGSPRVGNIAFANLYEGLNDSVSTWTLSKPFYTYRVFNTEDVVPTLPPSAPWVQYTHVGIPIAFTINLGNIVENHIDAYIGHLPE